MDVGDIGDDACAVYGRHHAIACSGSWNRIPADRVSGSWLHGAIGGAGLFITGRHRRVRRALHHHLSWSASSDMDLSATHGRWCYGAATTSHHSHQPEARGAREGLTLE